MVIKPSSDPVRSNPSSMADRYSLSTMSTHLDSGLHSWGSRYGREKLHTYKGKYGRITTYDLPSEVNKSRHEFTRSFSESYGRSNVRSSRFDDVNETRVRIGGRTRVVQSEDREVNLELTRSNRLLQSSRSIDYMGRASKYDVNIDMDNDKENKPIRRFGNLPSRRFQRSMSVDRGDTMMEIDRDLRRRPKSRFLDTYSKAAIKRKVEEVYDRNHEYFSTDIEVQKPKSFAPGKDYEYTGLDFRTMYDGVRRMPRSASVSRFDDVDVEKITSRVRRSSSVSRTENMDWNVTPKKTYRSRRNELAMSGELSDFQRSRDGSDLASYVMDPGDRFEPDDVQVMDLGSGKRMVTMTKSQQSGHGNEKDANSALNRVIEKTRCMEQRMSTLEEFVRRNRSMFPEDTRIYQSVRYFLLNETQLKEIGEPPDAEVYGIKIVEKLVVPPGTDVNFLLSRYHGKSDVEFEYDEKETRKREVDEQMETDFVKMQEDIRKKVEIEWELREKRRVVGDEAYEVKIATSHSNQRDNYGHMHSHVTPKYIQSIYRDAGLNYDDIYQTRSRYSSYASSITSDQESTRSSLSSRRKKRYDAAPTFTAKLRPKKCYAGQTIRFNCSVSGLPMPNVQWAHGTRIVNDGGRFHISVSDHYI